MGTSTTTSFTAAVCNDTFLHNRRLNRPHNRRRSISSLNHRHQQQLLLSVSARVCFTISYFLYILCIHCSTFVQFKPIHITSIKRTSTNRLPSYSSAITTRCSSSQSQIKVAEEEDDNSNVNDEEACELVNGMEISISTGELESDVSIGAYLLQAVKNNNGIGILLLSDIYGFEDSSTRDFAYRVACNGYNVLVPDLFRGDPWSKDKPNDLFQSWLSNQNPTRVTSDILASSKWLLDGFEAVGISKKLGLIGFCFGGGRVVDILAQDNGKSFRTGVSFYGTRINTAVANDVKVPMLFIVGDNDPLCSINDLEGIVENGNGMSLEIFKGRGHGFAHRPQTSEEDADAEEAFVKLRNWLHNSFLLPE